MREHELKIWPEHFEPVADGSKTFEVRRDDRGYRVNDVLRLREYVPAFRRAEGELYTGREIRKVVTYLLEGDSPASIGLQRGYVILALGSEATPTRGGSDADR